LAARDTGGESQRGEIDEAPRVGRLERVPVALETRRVLEPLLEAAFHVRPRAPAADVLRLVEDSGDAEGGDDVELRRPRALRLDANVERQAVPVDLRRRGRRDRRHTLERPAL